VYISVVYSGSKRTSSYNYSVNSVTLASYRLFLLLRRARI